MAKKKRILYPVIFMILITASFTFLLAFINNVTKSTIEEQEALRVKKSVLFTFGFETDTLTDDAIFDLFDEKIVEETVDDTTVYIYKEDKILGYTFKFSGKGLWGTITGHVAISPDHKKILGVNFTSHSETPGLGGRIDEIEFKGQFSGIEMTEGELIKYGTATGGNVDAISGATLTSLAVKDIFNTEIPKILDFAVKEGFYEGN